MREIKPLCKIGDKFYRIIKDKIVETTIIDIYQPALGHYVYTDDLKYNSNSFTRNFPERYFKTREMAEEMLNLREDYAIAKEEYERIKDEKFGAIKDLVNINREQMIKED